MTKSALFLLASLPAAVNASNDHLSATGYYHENGLYEPGYVNYRFDQGSTREIADLSPAMGGYYQDNGVFEPAYLNYRFRNAGLLKTPGKNFVSGGYFDSNGIFEPGYVNYRFAPDPVDNSCRATVAKGTVDSSLC
jgi:hypothetical protein